ncbi:hypothetical protein BGZ60DRAFT_523113 [Tricladium varicosporioides]|nr:hypothetical protein BGZ60DRAFT_523113 [Hymenoscyphus varicosporioides]
MAQNWNPFLTPANEATPPGNTFSVPLASDPELDNPEEWEYEYSTTETDTYYVTLDLTNPYLPPTQPRANRGPSKTRWSNPGLGRTPRKNLGPKVFDTEARGKKNQDTAPNAADNESVIDVDEDEVEVQIMRELGGNGTNGQTEEDQDVAEPDDEEELKTVQILDLHTKNPLISYNGNVFSCQWGQNIGSEFLFTKHDENSTLPILRNLPGNVDLLGVSSVRLTSKTVKVEHKANAKKVLREKIPDIYLDTGSRSKTRIAGQAMFLQGLMEIKEANGEEDLVTIHTQARLTPAKWKLEVQEKRLKERAKLQNIRNRGTEKQKAEAQRRLEELDQEDAKLAKLQLPAADRRSHKPKLGRKPKTPRDPNAPRASRKKVAPNGHGILATIPKKRGRPANNPGRLPARGVILESPMATRSQSRETFTTPSQLGMGGLARSFDDASKLSDDSGEEYGGMDLVIEDEDGDFNDEEEADTATPGRDGKGYEYPDPDEIFDL